MESRISDHDLERYHLGLVTREEELANPEEHLARCPKCVEETEETQHYVGALWVALADLNDPLKALDTPLRPARPVRQSGAVRDVKLCPVAVSPNGRNLND
jgi:hypothetical protein